MQSGQTEQLSFFGQDGCCGKTSPACSVQESRPARISGSSLRKPAAWRTVPRLYLDLRAGHGSLLGPLWETDFPSLTGQWTPNFSECPKDAAVCSLSRILEASPPQKFYLSQKACMGILRRADKRGKQLPPVLREALEIQAGLREAADGQWPDAPVAFACNQRDEARDLHDVSGALQAQPGMKQQTFVAEAVTKGDGDCFLTPETHTTLSRGGGQAGQGHPCVFTAGFCAGASPTAGNIGWQEECSPTLKAAESGTNMVPSVLCINDQGGDRMDISRDLTGTIRAQMDGHPPLVMATQQGGAEIGVDLCPTITAAAGMSGNNQPVVFDHHWPDARVTGPIVPTTKRHYAIPSVYTPEEVEMVLASVDRNKATGKRDYAILLLAARLGIRRSDIAALTFDSLKSDAIMFTQTKTKSKQTLIFLPEVRAAIDDYVNNSRPKSSYQEIFLDKGGYSPISAGNVSGIVHSAFVRSGVNCKSRRSGPHSLRASLATALLAEGNSYFTVQKLLGHANVQTSKSYAKADAEQLRICALPTPAPTGNFKALLRPRGAAV